MSNFPRGQQSTWYWLEAKNNEDNIAKTEEASSSSQPAIKVKEQSVPMDVQSSELETKETFKEEHKNKERFKEHPTMSSFLRGQESTWYWLRENDDLRPEDSAAASSRPVRIKQEERMEMEEPKETPAKPAAISKSEETAKNPESPTTQNESQPKLHPGQTGTSRWHWNLAPGSRAELPPTTGKVTNFGCDPLASWMSSLHPSFN